MRTSMMAAFGLSLVVSGVAAAQVVPTGPGQVYGGLHVTRNTNATTLAQRLVPSNDPRLTFVSGAGSFLFDSPATSSGAYVAQNLYIAGTGTPGTIAQILNNYDIIESGVILSTGDVEEYETGQDDVDDQTYDYGSSPTAPQVALLEAAYPGSGVSFFDTTQLDVTVNSCTAQRVIFEFVYGSEEYDEYVPGYTDMFAIFVDGVPTEAVIVNLQNFAYVAETELDGVEVRCGTPVIRAIASVPAGQSVVTFMISDVNDSIVDSTVYIEPIRSLADYNQNGVIDFSDVSDFLNDFGAEDCKADLDGDGEFTEDDANILIAEINATCP